MSDDLPVLILAGGQSRRMAPEDKLLQRVDGEPLLRRVARTALAVTPAVHVVLPPDRPDRVDALTDLPLVLHRLDATKEGMSGSLREGVAALPPCPAFMVLLADIPDLDAADLAAVIAARDAHPEHLIWRGATAAGAPGHPILFAASLRPAFAQLAGDGGGESLVGPLKDRTCLVRFSDDRARRDLDTPEDWAAWHAARS